MLTLFLWNPRIGALTSDKDPVKTKYYKDQMENMRDTDELLPMNMSSTPLFASSFNGWKYQRMQDVIEFVMKHDISPPKFEEECIAEGLIKPMNTDRLTAAQKATVKNYAEAYYKEYW